MSDVGQGPAAGGGAPTPEPDEKTAHDGGASGSHGAPSGAQESVPATVPPGSGLPENIAGALAYLLGPITGVVFFLLDRQRAYVRFHAVQCIALCLVGIALSVVVTVLTTILAFIPILGWLVGLLISVGLGLGGFALWLWLMLQAYKGNEWAVPGLEPHVRKLTAETGVPAGAA